MDPRLFRAAQVGDVDALQMLLIEHPRICNRQTLRKNTVMHFAAKEGHSEFVKKLLQLKLVISGHVNTDGNTPLHEAAQQGHSQVVEILLNHNKLDAHILNKEGVSPLFMAAEKGHLAIVGQLLNVRSPAIKFDRKRHSDGQICVHAAARGGHLGVVIELLNLRNDMVKIADKYGSTPLHSAIIPGHMEIVKELINRDSTLCYKVDKFGRSPLDLAAMKGHVDIVRELVYCVPDCMEFRSKDGKTALHLAVEYKHGDVVSYLLEAYINLVNEPDNKGNTVLHLAVIKKLQQMVELLLLSPRLNINAINKQGFTALDIVKNEKDHINMESMISMEEVLERNGGRQGPGPLTLCEKTSTVERLSNLGNIGSLVAGLIATVTFEAVLNIPGYLQVEASSSRSPSVFSISDFGKFSYLKTFMVLDAIAFFAALNVILIWLFMEPLQLSKPKRMRRIMVVSNVVLGIALFFMAMAFYSFYVMILIQSSLRETVEPSLTLTMGMMFTFMVGPGLCAFVFVKEVQSKRKKCLAIFISFITVGGVGFLFGFFSDSEFFVSATFWVGGFVFFFGLFFILKYP
eukprot:Gb_01863 [translate_table: standard]